MLGLVQGGLGEAPPPNSPLQLPLESPSFFVWKMELFSGTGH